MTYNARQYFTCTFRVATILFGSVLLHSSLAWARNPEQNKIYRSGHYLLRGDTGIGDADDQEAIWYNPAGIAQGTGIYKRTVLGSPQLEVSSNARKIYTRIAVDKENQTEVLKDQVGKPLHVGLANLTALVFRRAALGATLTNNANLLVRKDPDAGAIETVDADFASNQAVTFSLAEGFFGNSLLVGATGKYVNRTDGEISQNILDAQSMNDLDSTKLTKMGRGMGFDVGMMLKSDRSARLTDHSFGLTLRDVGDTNFSPVKDSEKPDPLFQTLNAGYTLTLGTKISRFKLMLDFQDITGKVETNALKRLHTGGEINVLEFVGICGGLNQGYATAGMYINVRFFRMDVGYYTEERGERVGMYPDQRYVLRLMVGL